MNVFALSLASLRHRPLPAVLTVLLLAVGIAMVVLLIQFERALEERLGRDARGIHLVVGAKGSGLQLVLATVFHVDVPTGNIPLADARLVASHQMVESVIPIATGDAYRGFRIVGTTDAYIDHYEGRYARGRGWEGSLEAVLGARVARETGFRVGSTFLGAHGLGDAEGMQHSDHPYRVVGVLHETGTVLDRLILVSVESVWDVHAVHGSGAASSGEGGVDATGLPSGDGEITALLVRYRTPLAAVTLPRAINAETHMQAASPAQESARVFQLAGAGLDAFRGFAWVLIAASVLSLFIALTHALHEQRYDLVVLRTLGASRGRVLRLVLVQAGLTGVAGAICGAALGHGAAALLSGWLERTRSIALGGGFSWAPEEGYVLLGAVLLALVAALIPAVRAHRLDLLAVLSERR